MITLQRPDPQVSVFLGENKGIKEGDRIRPSLFALPFETDGQEIVHNTFTCACAETSRYKWFTQPEELIFDPKDEEMVALVNADYLVKADIDEAERYEKILAILRRMRKKSKGYRSYTILPTTACNARCVYCYELEIPKITMSDETVEQVIRYILTTKEPDAPVNLHWFGGEPTVGEKIIDRICAAMREADVKYSSNMISNASLFTEEMAEKAKEDWHLRSIQVTLDGTEKIYCERKNYPSFSGSPYRAVLRAICLLLEKDVRVSIRLNADEENLEDLHQLVRELDEEMPNDPKLSIYCHSIFADENDTADRDNDVLYEGMEELDKDLLAFNRKRRAAGSAAANAGDSIDVTEDEPVEEEAEEKDGEPKNFFDRRGSLRRFHCMVDGPSTGPVILPDGTLNLCEHIGELPVAGHISDMAPVDRERFYERKRCENEKCRACKLLPYCTDFSSCPVINRDCVRENQYALRTRLLDIAGKDKLPPMTLRLDGEIIRVVEPGRDFALRSMRYLAPDYLKAERTVREDEVTLPEA